MTERDGPQSFEANARTLKDALDQVVPNRKGKKQFRLALHSTPGPRFKIVDATYRSLGCEIDCSGMWHEEIEVDGHLLRRVTETFSDQSTIILRIDNVALRIASGNASFNLNRLDPHGKGKTKRKAVPHTGKPQHAPDPVTKRAEFHDTWGFSAHVPMPESAVKDEQK